ncbi:hypothetical protein MM221_15325 [Salipaludibacillus sp. LMS25]|uniref:hypothetical protein n=1 Tax=Salipaludibacillus sp. LMS25 TaxID=2924031 RepID=UPI0020D19393|nr:hypothetical protein [Salipaludibacillus sp. LMS25]UTR13968.1 hypothetical protein MM221_15325 [Salipaludibacillus sp. LMS25]
MKKKLLIIGSSMTALVSIFLLYVAYEFYVVNKEWRETDKIYSLLAEAYNYHDGEWIDEERQQFQDFKRKYSERKLDEDFQNSDISYELRMAIFWTVRAGEELELYENTGYLNRENFVDSMDLAHTYRMMELDEQLYYRDLDL